MDHLFRAFVVDDTPEPDIMAVQKTFTCGWDNLWDPLIPTLSCNWTHCLRPMVPPEATIVAGEWDGDVIDFGTHFPYVCDRRMHFSGDDQFDQEFITAECIPNNEWDEPSPWGQCVDSEWHKNIHWVKRPTYD